MYPKTYYKHQLGSVVVDEALTNIKAHGLQIVGWTLTEKQQLMKLNLGIDAKPVATLALARDQGKGVARLRAYK